jgi:hypothetical protein
MSFCRIDHEGAPHELQTALQVVASRNPRRRIEGTAIAIAENVGAIRDGEGGSAFVILDDGCDCYRSHAVLRANHGITRAALRGPRDELLQLLNNTIMRQTA